MFKIAYPRQLCTKQLLKFLSPQCISVYTGAYMDTLDPNLICIHKHSSILNH